MHVIIGLPDWYTPPNNSPELGRMAAAARETLAERFPEVRLYEFLPVATLQVKDLRDVEALTAISGVTYVLEATSAMDVPGAARYYDRMLSALSAIRSESAHQRYEWSVAANEGAVFPHERWVGGIWPSHHYPSVDLSGRLLREDPALTRWAAPAQISVLSLSVGPAHQLPTEPNDPVVIALDVMASSHLVVVAAGNHGPGEGSMNPWALGPVLSVGALDEEGGLWKGSSRGRPGDGSGPHVVASGVVPGDIGTSYAAPRVAVLGAFCAAVLSQLNAALSQAQDLAVGVPLEALAVIDVSPQTLDVEIGETLPSVEIPALPMMGLNHNLAVDAFRTVIPDFVASHGGRGLVNLPIAPQQLAELIRAAAQPLQGAHEWEAGSGAVDAAGMVDYFASVAIGETLRWLGFETKSLGSAGGKPTFHRDGLGVLMESVRLARPVYIWDVHHGRFVRGSELKTARGDLNDLRNLVLSQHLGGGHVARILSATLT